MLDRFNKENVSKGFLGGKQSGKQMSSKNLRRVVTDSGLVFQIIISIYSVAVTYVAVWGLLLRLRYCNILKQYFSIIYDFMLKGQLYFRFVKLGGYGHHIKQCAVLNL